MRACAPRATVAAAMPDRVEQLAHDHLAAEHADRPGQGARAGRRSRRPGRRRSSRRTPRPRPSRRPPACRAAAAARPPPDRVGGHRGPARGVDPQHDGLRRGRPRRPRAGRRRPCRCPRATQQAAALRPAGSRRRLRRARPCAAPGGVPGRWGRRRRRQRSANSSSGVPAEPRPDRRRTPRRDSRAGRPARRRGRLGAGSGARSTSSRTRRVEPARLRDRLDDARRTTSRRAGRAPPGGPGCTRCRMIRCRPRSCTRAAGRAAAPCPSLSSAPRRNVLSTATPVRPRSPEGCSQISSNAVAST